VTFPLGRINLHKADVLRCEIVMTIRTFERPISAHQFPNGNTLTITKTISKNSLLVN